MAGTLRLNLRKGFPGGFHLEARLELEEASRLTVLFGPSAAGKTTLLRCLAGLERPQQGYIEFRGEPWLDREKGVELPPQQRRVGYVPQQDCLFPHLDVLGNVRYGRRGRPAAEAEAEARRWAERLGLEDLLGRFPNTLSGGERRRVALARALARDPQLLLLDEPLNGLDRPAARRLAEDLRRLVEELRLPTLLVTHDRVEALELGEELVVLDQGRVLQKGPIQEVFSRPADLRVAQIVGVDTILAGQVVSRHGGLAQVQVGPVRLTALEREPAPGPVFVSIRAEDVLLEASSPTLSSARNRLPGRVKEIIPEGRVWRVELECGVPLQALVTHPALEELELRPGREVQAVVKAHAIHLIPRFTSDDR